MEKWTSFEKDITYIASLGMDHIRLGFDQIIVEESKGFYRENICSIIENYIIRINRGKNYERITVKR